MSTTTVPTQAGLSKMTGSKSIWLSAFVLFVLCLIGFGNSFKNGFMLDDYIIIFGEKGVSNETFGEILTQNKGSFYRPVQYMCFKLMYYLFGENPFGYHLINLPLVFLTSFLFYLILKKLFHDRNLALLSSALYSVHPIHSIMVNYTEGIAFSFFNILVQLCFLNLVLFVDKQKKVDYFFSVFFFILSLLWHEFSLIVPAFLFCVLYFLKDFRFWRAIKLCLPYALIAILNIAFRLGAFNFQRVFYGSGHAKEKLINYMPTLMDLLGWYISKLVFPKDVLFQWTGTLTEEHLVLKTLAFLLIASIIIYLVFFRWKKGMKPFALAIFTVGLIPMALASFTYYPFTGPMIEPHWFSFSSIGFFVIVAYALLKAKEKIYPKAWAGLVACVLLSLISLMWENSSHWRTQETYCRYWLKLNPRNLTPYYGMGKTRMNEDDYVGAQYYFQRGIDKLGYNNIFILADLGYCYHVLGKDRSALRFFQAALKEDAEYSLTYHYLGILFLSNGNDQQAYTYFMKAIQLYPRLFRSRENLLKSKDVKGLNERVLNIYDQLSAQL